LLFISTSDWSLIQLNRFLTRRQRQRLLPLSSCLPLFVRRIFLMSMVEIMKSLEGSQGIDSGMLHPD
jgi:hypothetical protein